MLFSGYFVFLRQLASEDTFLVKRPGHLTQPRPRILFSPQKTLVVSTFANPVGAFKAYFLQFI